MFVSNREGNSEIYVMDINGENLVNITRNTARDGVPSWSPDGSKIVFSSERDGNWEIYVAKSNGNCIRRLTNNPADDYLPFWCCQSLTSTSSPFTVIVLSAALILMIAFLVQNRKLEEMQETQETQETQIEKYKDET